MSLILITNPPSVLVSDSDWTDLVIRSNANMLGHGLSIPIFTLTNWDGSTTKPQIAEGSIIEVGGSFYQADADTALTDEGGLSDGTVHIKLVPAGGGASVVPTLTNDVIPAWDANKAGWYDSDDKFLPFEMVKASAVFTEKSEYIDQNKNVKMTLEGFYDLTINNNLDVNNDLEVTGDATANSINTGNIAVKMKVISGSTGGGNSVTLAHGLTSTKIRGLAPSTVGIREIDNFAVDGGDVFVLLNGTSSQTVYVIVFYID